MLPLRGPQFYCTLYSFIRISCFVFLNKLWCYQDERARGLMQLERENGTKKWKVLIVKWKWGCMIDDKW